MINKDIAFALGGFLFGSVVGGISTYFVVRKTFEMEAEKEIGLVREHYSKRDEAEKKKQQRDIEEQVLTLNERRIEKYHKQNRELGYDTVSDETDEDTSAIPPSVTRWYDKIQESNTTPVIISRKEYENENLEFDKVSYTYDADEETLVDEVGDLIPKPEDSVGLLALHNFGRESGDPNIVYVRNEALMLDIEIVRTSNGYSAGMFEDPEPVQQRVRKMKVTD